MIYAAIGQKLNVIKYLEKKYPNRSWDWNELLQEVVDEDDKGHMLDIIKYFIQKGANRLDDIFSLLIVHLDSPEIVKYILSLNLPFSGLQWLDLYNTAIEYFKETKNPIYKKHANIFYPHITH